ncbi:helix-turn-helix domain-containing protein [Pseudonocardia petroleophila]|uniref:Helix-turn-helix transcriptional regulator n=1 Tax=Pseudonocardia petroleophila TaxID=37331 RepID=A0A7G7MKI4_9PSEU|nr:helix-turn-helix transcriptional regulator [Pseudonocardia petroleophila]QNG53295.1 helix-turn-helix transcriptional regulator [Pseudonocardia petroleophila]
MTETMTIGERVAFYRRRRGMAQVVLAGLVGRTEDWLSRVENNKIELDRLSVIRNLADALDVTLADLVAEPALLDWTSDSGVRTIPALRAVLMNYGLAVPALADDSSDEPPSLDDVQRAIGEVFDAYQASRYGYVTGRAPSVLSDALRASRAAGADETNRASALLALAYQSTVSVLTKLGETDLAWIASERGLYAAQAADNPVVLGSLFRCVAHAVHSTGRFQDGVRLVQSAANVLEPHIGTRAEDALVSVYGTLFLTGAVAAARADDRGSVTSFLAEAAECAGRVGRDANAMWTAFGPTNVAIHRMTAAMELGDVQIAVDLAPRIDTSRLPAERRVRHAIETARAYTARNRRDDALGVLLDAEQLAPEQIRHHAISRQLVLSWLRNNRGARSVALEQLAGRLRLA